MRSPEVIVYTVASFVGYWAGLYDEDGVAKIREGAEKLMEKTAEVMRGVQGGGPGTSGLLIMGSEA